MAKFDRTESEYIVQKIEEEVQLPQLGTVVEVYEHDNPDDPYNFECDVILREDQSERRAILYASPSKDNVQVPQEGDLVMVQFLEGEDERPVVTRALYTNEQRPPLAKPGMHRERRGKLYYELHQDGDWIRFAHKDSDDGTPNAKIEIDSSGNINISGANYSNRTDVSDDGSTIVNSVTDINFGTNISVTDDGDGSVTVDGAPGTSVSEDGSVVVSGVGDVNFTTGLDVSDDGDGTVTVSASTQYTDEDAQDAVGTILDSQFTYDDAANSISLNQGDGSGLNADLWDGRELYVQSSEPGSANTGDLWIETA